MKRYISTLALCAMAVIGLGSCNKVQEADVVDDVRTVSFQAQMGNDTRTGLALKFVPDWRETELDDVHLFETHNNDVVEGKEKTMTVEPGTNNEVARFTADFQDSWVIIVDPSEPSAHSAPETRASASDYVYTSIVAQRDGNGKYYVPSVQYPETATLIDPKADFLVANGVQTYERGQSNKQLDLRFVRPVSISRLEIMNIPDAKVKQVVIYSENALTASAAYSDVNFETSQVAFDETNGSKVLTISYGDAGVSFPNEGIFNAYFVSLAGTKMITKIEVTTDVKTYTKEVNKSLVFKTPDFKSIAVNMAGASGGTTPEPQTPVAQTLSFVRGGKTFSVSSPDNYDLSNGAANYVAPTLTGVQGSPAPTVTWTIVCDPAGCASVNQNGAVTLNGTGTSTITAKVAAVGNYLETTASYKLVVIESSLPQQTVSFMKGGKTITEDTFELGSGEYKMPMVETNALEYAVTWSVSNNKASIVENKVVPKAVGDVVVTATVVAPGYADKEISYTLHITGDTPEPQTPTAQNLSFSPTSVSGKVGESVTAPVLSGAFTTVTYSSSNTTAVDVDVTSGALTLKAEGTATITATAAAGTVSGTTYAEGSATYTVTVSPADPAPATGKTYTRISGSAELVTGTYLIVEKTDTYVYNASGNNHGGYGTIGSTTGITKSGTTITLSEDIASSYEFVFTKSGDNLTIQPASGSNAGKYMYATNNVSDTYIDFQTSANNFTVNSQTGDLVYFRTTKGTSNTEYLYKKSADSFFKLGGSGAPGGSDAGIYLYKLNGGGTTPEPPTPSANPTYTLIEGDANLVSGTYVIADKTNAYLLNASGSNNGGYSTIGTTSGVTKSGSTITLSESVAEAHEFVITRDGNTLTIKKVGGDHAGQYLFASTSVSNSYMGFQSSAKNFTLNPQENTNYIFFYTDKSSSSPEEYLYKKSGDSYFKLGQSGKPGVAANTDAGVLLYKKN